MSPVSPIFHIVLTVNSWSQTCFRTTACSLDLKCPWSYLLGSAIPHDAYHSLRFNLLIFLHGDVRVGHLWEESIGLVPCLIYWTQYNHQYRLCLQVLSVFDPAGIRTRDLSIVKRTYCQLRRNGLIANRKLDCLTYQFLNNKTNLNSHFNSFFVVYMLENNQNNKQWYW